jgi:hypothetical protein
MEIWEPVKVTNAPEAPPAATSLPTWQPILGLEFNRYVARLPSDQQNRLTNETLRILNTAVDPSKVLSEPRVNAGLVLGYVQSGKTSSFTAATALAHDNGYDLVIVVAGVNNILSNQTYDRLQRDLDLDKSDAVNRWAKVLNPKVGKGPAVQQVQNLITTRAQARSAGRVPVGQVPLIVVMKQTVHLKNLNALLAGIAASGPIKGLTALVIDDECHMATPNVAKRDDAQQLAKSKIYDLMGEMRSYLPHHTLLQYTATPQANLLCALEDEFRSDFVRLLGHGPGYAGGRAFFVDPPAGQSIRQIPSLEQSEALAATMNDESVPSLRRALATFLLIAANDYRERILDQTHKFERFSMLVHSSSGVQTHGVFHHWLTSLKNAWLAVIGSQAGSPDWIQLKGDEFVPAYDDLLKTSVNPLRPLDELYGEPIAYVLQFLQLWLINAGQGGTNQPDFAISNYNILNGGEILGVGFTIPRLHVTHMLRTAGQGQMDTIQQRGRFFGYCGSWLDQTRVWLEDEVREAFEGYVDEEEFLRRDLKEYDEQNKSLKGWKVRLRLNPNAKPCRRAAVRRELQRFQTNEGWVYQRYYLADDVAQALNRSLLNNFFAASGDFAAPGRNAISLAAADPKFRGATWSTQHEEAVCDLEALKILLSSFVVNQRDRARFDVLFETVDEAIGNPQIHQGVNVGQADLFVMAGKSRPRLRRREIGANEPTVDLPQGPGVGNEKYVGDRQVHSTKITLQIHNLNHGPTDKQLDKLDIPYLGVWLPDVSRQWAENWIHEA